MQFAIIGKFVAYGTMVKILATLKSPYAKAFYLIQKLGPAIEMVYLSQCFGYKFFLS